MIMDFITIALDQIINVAAKARYATNGRTTAPMTVRTAVFAGSGLDRRTRSRLRRG